jgi:hypothetical protein
MPKTRGNQFYSSSSCVVRTYEYFACLAGIERIHFSLIILLGQQQEQEQQERSSCCCSLVTVRLSSKLSERQASTSY